MGFYKTIAIAIFEKWLYHDIFSLPSINNLGLFDKIVPMKNGLWILPVGTGFLKLPMKIELLILLVGTGLLTLPMKIGLLNNASENWVFDE